MKYVNLLQLQENGKQKIVATFVWASPNIEIIGNEVEMAKKLVKDGITGYLEKKYKLSDGLKFLEQLKYAFTGSYLRATDVLT